MRLRLLFFPLMLVVSVAIIVLVIVPQWEQLKLNQEQMTQKQKSLENVTLKKQNVEKLGAYLEEKKTDVDFINAYLPAKKNEENVIDAINYLAINSSVAVGNIDVEHVKLAPIAVPEDPGVGVPTMGSGLPAADGSSGDSAAAAPVMPQVQLTAAKINVIGTYESLVIFLNNLQQVEMYSSIESVKVTTNKKEEIEGKIVQQGPELLIADIVVNFGYLEKASVENGYANPLFEKSSYNASVIEALRKLVQTKIPPLDVSEAGKLNPFVL